jgi:heme exporter protein B
VRALRLALWIARKDLRLELRSRQNFLTVLFFAFIVIVIFNFAFDPGSTAVAEVSPAILWVAFLFAGMLSLGNAFALEREEACMLGLLLAPVPRGVIFLGKFLANLLFLLAMEAIIFPIFVVFFNIRLTGDFLWLLLVVMLVDTGFVAVGTLFSAMTMSLKTREVLLPILLFPVVVPVVIAGVRATAAVFQGQGPAAMASWLKLLVGFDLVFMLVCYSVFQYVVEESS